MAIELKIVDDQVVFQHGDNQSFTIAEYKDFKSFVNQRQENLQELLDAIKEGLIFYANKELADMENGSFDMINETMAFTKIMQQATQHIWLLNVEQENKLKEEFQPPPPGEDF